MRQAFTWIIVSVLILAGGGVWWLKAQGPGTPPPIAAPTATPNLITVGTPTQVVFTVSIPEPTLNPASVNLLRVNPDGSSAIVAQMVDNGQNGDQQPGDKVFTARLTLNESTQTVFAFQASAAFRGILRRAISPSTQLGIVNPTGYAMADLASDASLIVHATATGQNTVQSDVGIFTDVTLTIDRVLRGQNVPTVIIVRVPGGVVGGASTFSLGTPFFNTGENVVLLLTGPDSVGRYSISHQALGTYHVRADPILGQLAVIDSAYSDINSVQVRNRQLQSFLQRSLAGQVSVSELYMRLGVAQ